MNKDKFILDVLYLLKIANLLVISRLVFIKVMLKTKYYFLLVCLLFVVSVATAQTTISGKVIDAKTQEPMPFVSVIIAGTNTGTTTDFDGFYQMSTQGKADSIIAVYIGYIRFAAAVEKGKTQTINIPLQQKEDGILIDEVVVNPGENPAWRVIRAVIAHKEINNKRRLDAYEYEAYNKLEFDLNNIPKDLKDKKAFKPIKFIFDNVDSGKVGEKPFLPLFMVETLSEFYYRDNPKAKQEIIKASKVTGIENSSVSQVMGDMYQNVNVYDNDILVFGKDFKSPISDNAIFNYKFYLEDSLFIDGKWCYQIRFKPKRKQELLFSGNMWIADSTWGVKRLEMSIPDDANINFIQTANIIQEFTFIDSIWFLNKDRLVIDFIPDLGFGGKKNDKKTGIYGRKTTSYKKIVLNKPKPQEFFKFGDNIIVEDSATKKTDEFWNGARHDSLTVSEKKIYKMIDTIQQLPIYRTWYDVISVLVAGYYTAGNFDIGPYFNLLSYNRLEGPRLRIGGRTSTNFSKWYELNGYVAYGFKDEKWKYAAGFKTFLHKNPNGYRQIIGMNYKSDLEILGQSQNGFTADNFFASFFRRTPLNAYTRVEQTQLWYEHEWFEGFNQKVFFVNRKLTPLGDYKYNYIKPNGEIGQKDFLRTSEIRLVTRFAYDEKYISGDFLRTSLGTKYPVLQLTLTHSLKHIYEGQYQYKKVVLNVSDRIRLGSLLGYTDYVIEGGKIWGKVPYPFLELHGGNQTYVYDYMAYNMMNYYEFASDQYASFWAFHHFEGLFFNKFPLLKRLKWREVVTYKVLFGSVNADNQKELLFPSTLYSLNNKPYHEVSAGVENIFKFFRVDAFWRLSYRDNPKAPKFGIRAGFQLAF